MPQLSLPLSQPDSAHEREPVQRSASFGSAKHRRGRDSARRVRVKTARPPRRARGPVKAPAPIGPVPRMLDQLKRRCSRLLLGGQLLKEDAHMLPALGMKADRSAQRVATRVDFNSKTVRQILAHWNDRSALAPMVENDATTIAVAALASPNKLSLLVWRAPRRTDEHGHLTLHASVDPWHVIPVTHHEALQFQHIPVGLRESIISAHAKQYIDRQLLALHNLLQVMRTSSPDDRPGETDVIAEAATATATVTNTDEMRQTVN